MGKYEGCTMLIYDTATPFLEKEWRALAAAHGMNVEYCYANTQDELMQYFASNKVRIVLNSYLVATRIGRYTPEMIAQIAASGVEAVCHEGAGYESVGDIEEWKKHGVQVSCCPDSVALDTANTAVYLLIAAMRNFNALSKSLRDGQWTGNVPLGITSEGRTLGILGMGNIGRQIRDRASTLGFARIQYHTRNRLVPEIEKGTHYVGSLDELLATSDVLLLILPLNKHTHHMFNAETFAKCRDGVVIVNIARGAIIDEQALVDALRSGKVRSAGLDVYEHEPLVHPDLVSNNLLTLLPHAGPRTETTRLGLERELFANAREFLETGTVLNLVPEMRR